MKLSVIVPCYNAADTLAVQLEALAGQSVPAWEVVVADNGSTDASVAIAQQFSHRLPRFQVISATGRRGAAHARNAGVRAATGEAIAFCDADDQVATDWVAAVSNALTRHDFIASRFEDRRLNSPALCELRRNPQADGIQQYPDNAFFPNAGGCGLGIKRSLHDKVGGFDESMLYLEDTDYCWKVQLTGAKLQFVPEAVVHIRYRSTLGATLWQSKRWAEYRVLLYKRYGPYGIPVPSLRTSLGKWIYFLKRLFGLLLRREKFSDLTWLIGARLGYLQGSLKYRMWVL